MQQTPSNTHTSIAGVTLPLQGPFARWPYISDSLLAAVVLIATVSIGFEGQDQDPILRECCSLPSFAYVLFAASCAPLIWRRKWPILVLCITWLISLLSILLDFSDSPLFAIMFSLYSVGRYAADDKLSYYSVWASIALVAFGDLFNSMATPSTIMALLVAFLIWYVGRRFHLRSNYISLLQQHANQLEREQVIESRRAVAEEKTRIARELHDVVAHQVSLMTVQAGAAKTVVIEDPEAALNAMKAVENAGRQALDELRHLMGILRPESDADGLNPQPGLADIPILIDHLRKAGLKISLSTELGQIKFPARLELSAYRIVQEALTNVLKHAGPDAKTEVRLSTKNQGIVIEVVDNGLGATILPGTDHGIVGMRERAQLLGGSFSIGPRSEGGFRVFAHLPLEGDPL